MHNKSYSGNKYVSNEKKIAGDEAWAQRMLNLIRASNR